MTNETMTGQQISAVQKRVDEVTRAMLTDIELRKLAMRHTIDLLQATATNYQPSDVIMLAQQIHAFLVTPAAQNPSATE